MTEQPGPDPMPEAAPQGEPADAGAVYEQLWSVASHLASGMLANPARSHFSVKDSISLFDELLSEMTSYARVRGQLSGWDPAMDEDRRRQRDRRASEYLKDMPQVRPIPSLPQGHGAPPPGAQQHWSAQQPDAARPTLADHMAQRPPGPPQQPKPSMYGGDPLALGLLPSSEQLRGMGIGMGPANANDPHQAGRSGHDEDAAGDQPAA